MELIWRWPGTSGFGPGANVGLRRWLEHRRRASGSALAPHDALPGAGLPAAAARRRRAPPAGRPGLRRRRRRRTRPCVDPLLRRHPIRAGDASTEGWEPADYPHGTLLLARRACLEEVGLFDERYFAYCEEADLGLRARGRRVGDRPRARRRGRATRTSASRVAVVDYLQLRNTLLLVREHFGRYKAFIRCCIALWHLADGVVRPHREQWIFLPRARLQGAAGLRARPLRPTARRPAGLRASAAPAPQRSSPRSVAATSGRMRSRYQSEMSSPPTTVRTPRGMATIQTT